MMRVLRDLIVLLTDNSHDLKHTISVRFARMCVSKPMWCFQGEWFILSMKYIIILNLVGNSGKISIYNLNGQLVHEQTAKGSESRINASGLNNGMYQVVFISENSTEIATQKLIISK